MRVATVLVDWGGQTLSNVGDLALAMVAVRQLGRVFPDAKIHLTAHDSPGFEHLFPGAERVPERAVQTLFWRRFLPARLSRTWPAVARAEENWFRRNPLRALRLRLWRGVTPDVRDEAMRVIELLGRTDLVVAAGGGYLTDTFLGYAHRILGLLEAAQCRGIPVVLFSQGIGPIEDPGLKDHAERVLRNARWIGLREGAMGASLLERWQIPAERVHVTGDDAFRFVRERDTGEDGPRPGLGFNLRLASYASPPPADSLQNLRDVIRRFAAARTAPIVICPIDCAAPGGDADSVRKLLGPDAVEEHFIPRADPAEVIRQVGRCRVVVTGSYHAAVFALGQGIPAVCLSHSKYYDLKFAGLAAQFGSGCRVVNLARPDGLQRLQADLSEVWEAAPGLREELERVATRIAHQTSAAYEALLRICETPARQ